MITYIGIFASMIGIPFLVAGIMIMFFIHALNMAHIRSNGVKLSAQQFPEVYDNVRELCARMGIAKIPDIYVMESSGMLNAFATRYLGRNMVVLYSELFELINEQGKEELTFVIAHELAHIQRKHITKQLLIMPALCFPFVAEAYSRACEYTSDRMAAYYAHNEEAAMNGLTILAIGKKLYRQVNRTEYLYQSSQERGLLIWLVEKLSTHPTLPKRIHELQQFYGEAAVNWGRASRKALLVTAAVSIIAIVSIIIGIVKVNDMIDTASDAVYEMDDGSKLTRAAAEGDLNEIRALLSAGTDANYQDSDGWTALMWAAQDNRTDMIQVLLGHGADPDIQNYMEESALIRAISNDYIEAVKVLIEQGADSNLPDSYGGTPLMAAASNGNMSIVQLLLEAGVEASHEDAEGTTAFMLAKKNGYHEVAELLR
ncbi:M48 family metallopeptidase [Paenibacillus sp. GCM10023252]|uniref:M48 family metallopeptidase n=1 Tax=Paenibacillus sp. GCM10023252 TaxID=3252649 RepID=UPI0036159347